MANLPDQWLRVETFGSAHLVDVTLFATIERHMRSTNVNERVIRFTDLFGSTVSLRVDHIIGLWECSEKAYQNEVEMTRLMNEMIERHKPPEWVP